MLHLFLATRFLSHHVFHNIQDVLLMFLSLKNDWGIWDKTLFYRDGLKFVNLIIGLRFLFKQQCSFSRSNRFTLWSLSDRQTDRQFYLTSEKIISGGGEWPQGLRVILPLETQSNCSEETQVEQLRRRPTVYKFHIDLHISTKTVQTYL